MTKKQNAWYWREWGAVKSACTAAGVPVPDRHELHVRALGQDKSHTLFDDEDFDDILGIFFAISKPANGKLQLRQVKMRRTRRIYRIRRFPEAYVLALLRSDRFKKCSLADMDTMSLEDLTDLRNTLCARLGGSRPKSAPEERPEPAPVQVVEAECPF